MQPDSLPISEQFMQLPVPLPPILAALVGHNGISRFFGLCYLGTKATWSTGAVAGNMVSTFDGFRVSA